LSTSFASEERRFSARTWPINRIRKRRADYCGHRNAAAGTVRRHSGFAAGLAFANPSSTQSANVLVVFRNVFGQQIGSATTYRAPADGHASVVLPVNVRG